MSRGLSRMEISMHDFETYGPVTRNYNLGITRVDAVAVLQNSINYRTDIANLSLPT